MDKIHSLIFTFLLRCLTIIFFRTCSDDLVCFLSLVSDIFLPPGCAQNHKSLGITATLFSKKQMHPTDSVCHDLCPSDINPSSNVGSQTLRSDGVGENAPLDASLTNWSHHIHLLHTHTHTHSVALTVEIKSTRGRQQWHWNNKCPRVKIRFIQIALQSWFSSCGVHVFIHAAGIGKK